MDEADKIKFIKVIGHRVKYFRNKIGFSQEKLALEADVEISQISRIERGVINTSIVQMAVIAKALEIPLYRLFQSDSF